MNNDDFFIGKTTTDSYIKEAHEGSLVLQHLVDVLNPSQSYVIKGVQFWRKRKDDTKLSKGATVLVWRANDFSACIVNVLEDPAETIDPAATTTSDVRPAKGPRSLYDPEFQQGEIYLESQRAAGGAYLYLSNAGDAYLAGGTSTDKITVSGSQRKITLQANEIEWGNYGNLLSSLISIPAIGYVPNAVISRGFINTVDDVGIEVRTRLTMMLQGQVQVDSVGNVTAKAFSPVGVAQAYLELLKTGQINLKNLTGSITINLAGQVNLNGGTKGAARVFDPIQFLPTDIVTLTTALLATGAFVASGNPPTPPTLPVDAGMIKSGSTKVMVG